MAEIKTTERIDDIAGKICKVLIPIKKEYFLGHGTRVGVCTLSSLDLLHQLSSSAAIMDKVAIVGRLLSENKGIDKMIGFAMDHPDLEQVVVCGLEVKGHLAGQALLSLARNGADPNGRIIGALGPYPILRADRSAIEEFRRRVKIVNYTGTTDVEKILRLVA